MTFKRFKEFIQEAAGPPTKDAGKEKKKDPKDIESADPLTPPINPEVGRVCPKCGKSEGVCNCYIDDYYDAKLPQQAPRPSIQKGKPKKK